MCLLVVLSPLPARAQLKADSGEIVGIVLDAQAARVPAVSISLSDPQRGFNRSTESGPEGAYRFALVPPSRYRLELQAAGFATHVVENVEVRVGETIKIDVTLAVAGVQVTVDVGPRPIALDPERVSQASVVTTGVLDAFPINRRNYLDFALLTPGVVETTTIADQADFRVPIAPTSGLSFASSNGRGNVVLLDGVSNNGATGNVRPSVPQEAVQEFQVNRSSYSAEYGGGLGGVVNIVTRSGGNTHRGTAFALLRDRRFDARNFFDPGHSPFRRAQTGGSAGGPIKHNRSFYFGAVERLDRRETVFVSTLRDQGVLNRVTASQQRVVDFLGRTGDPALGAFAGVLQTILTPSSNPLVVPLVAANSGAFPLTAGGTQASLRVDHRAAGHQLIFRSNVSDQTEKNAKFGALVGYSHGSATTWHDGTLLAADTYALNPRWVGVTRVSVAATRFEMLPNDSIGPELLIGGFGSFGRDYLLPFIQRERYLQLQQALSYSSARHSVKMGVDLNVIHDEGRVDTFFGGRFVFGEFIPLGLLAGPVQGAFATAPPDVVASLAQPITSLQAFSLGLPVAYVQAFGNAGSESSRQQDSAFVEYTYRPASRLSLVSGLRSQFNSNSNLKSVSYVDPRAGFTAALSDTTMVRGAYGVYHSWVDLNIAYSAKQLQRADVTNVFIPLSGVPTITNPQTGFPVTSADVYQSLLARRILGQRAVALTDLAPLGIDARIPFPVTGGVDELYTSPLSHQASVEVEHALKGTIVSASYNYSRTRHLWRTRDRNLRQAGTRADGAPIFGLVNPAILNNFVIESTGSAAYHALIVQANRRFGANWNIAAHYTVSDATDDVTDFNIDYAPHNQLDPAAERGPSIFNQRHRFLATAAFQSTDANAGAGWTVATIVRANSGRPFNVLTGFDNLGDGQANTHRPLGVDRNRGHGPAFVGVDVRVTRSLRTAVRIPNRVEVTAEAFNVLNRTNFQSVNNVVGNLSAAALPNPIVGHRGDPATPLAFTSVHDPRQIQLGVRIRF